VLRKLGFYFYFCAYSRSNPAIRKKKEGKEKEEEI
jgi:hypothetical protein